MTIRVVGLLCVAAGLAACANPASRTAPSMLETTSRGAGSSVATGAAATTSTAAPDPAAANYEVTFMSGMIDQHQMAVEMAELCLDWAWRPAHHAARDAARQQTSHRSMTAPAHGDDIRTRACRFADNDVGWRPVEHDRFARGSSARRR